MNLKDELISRGFNFLSLLGKRNILFSGISGSVSYEPGEEDDIDIFLITSRDRLWSTLLRAFIIRIINRDSRICLSLILDSLDAESMFTGKGDFVMASDSVHVIPYRGEEFYHGLLSRSPFVQKYFPGRGTSNISSLRDDKPRFNPLEPASFLLLSAWLTLKSLYHNHMFRRNGRYEDVFRPVILPHSFYFDSVKYHHLKELLQEPVSEEQ